MHGESNARRRAVERNNALKPGDAVQAYIDRHAAQLAHREAAQFLPAMNPADPRG